MTAWALAGATGLGIFLIGLELRVPWPRRAGFILATLAPLGAVWLDGEATQPLPRALWALVLGGAARIWIEGESVDALERGPARGAAVILAFLGTILGVAILSDLGPRSFVGVSPLAAWVTVGLLASALAGMKWIGRRGPP